MSLSYGNRLKIYRYTVEALAVATVGYTNVIDDHGAAGDGVTDDSAAFAAADATGKVIYVPGNRTYNLGAGEFSFSAPGMFGDGCNSSTLQWTGLTASEVAMRIDPTVSPFLQNIKLASTDGNGIGIGDSGASPLDLKMHEVCIDGFNYGFWCDDLENSVFIQCDFINNAYGVYTDPTAEWLHVSFYGCKWTSNTTVGVELGGSCEGSFWDACAFGLNGKGFVITANTQPRRGTHLHHCHFINNTSNDIEIKGDFHTSQIQNCFFNSTNPATAVDISPSSGGASDVNVEYGYWKQTYVTDIQFGANTTSCEASKNARGVTSDVTDSITVVDTGQANVINY